MARPLAHLPLIEPTPAPVDPLATERRQIARAACGRYARLLLRLADGLPVPTDAVAPLADLHSVIDDQEADISDELDALTDAWPELCEIAKPAIASLHRVTDGVGEVAHA